MKTWKTKEGKRIPIKKLANSHLLNILRMLGRVALLHKVKRELSYLTVPEWLKPRGDMAEMAFDAECDGEMMRTPADYLPDEYNDLAAEAMRRNLDIPPVPDDMTAAAVTLSLYKKLKPPKRPPA